MACKIIIFLGVGVLAHGALVQVAQPVRVVESVPVAEVQNYDTVPRYSFAYDVQDAITGDSKAQYETRNGNVVQGSYSLIESDGTRRIVDYTADDVNGFNAVISREPAVAVAAVSPVVPVSGISPVIPGVSLAESSPGVVASAGPVPTIPSNGADSDVEIVEARSGRLISGQSSANLRAKTQIKNTPVAVSEQDQRQVEYVPVSARANSVVASNNFQRFVNVPENRLNQPVYTYSSAYSSPFAFANPSGRLNYTPLIL